MKISIITVCYNSEETIRDTIESVIGQSYSEIEYIIVDGASSDTTLSIVNEYRKNISILISEPDRGIYDAMNKGVAAASGEFVGILNSDDIFANNQIIEELANFLQTNPDLDGSYADLVFVKRNDINAITRKYSSKIFSPRKIRYGIMCPHPTFYARTSLFNKLGFYDIKFPIAADFELITRFIIKGAKLRRFDSVMVRMREGGASTVSLKQHFIQNFELVHACKKNGIYTNIFMIWLKLPYKLYGYLNIK